MVHRPFAPIDTITHYFKYVYFLSPQAYQGEVVANAFMLAHVLGQQPIIGFVELHARHGTGTAVLQP